MQRFSAPGVRGIGLLVDPTKEATLTCRYTLDGYGSKALLQAAVDVMNSYSGQISGTITRTGNSAETIANCVFLGFMPEEEPKYSGGGTVGWLLRGRLLWIKLDG